MKIFTVDAFTDVPFKGNPAAVCVLDKKIADQHCLSIAQEINLSETAFIYLDQGEYQLRWFTPTNEVDLCGHATLATAKILFDKGFVQGNHVSFNSKSGKLTVDKKGDKLEMNFPIGKLDKVVADDLLIEFLGGHPKEVSIDNSWCIIELEGEEAIKNFKPNFDLLCQHGLESYVITAKSLSNDYDFVSRFFGPAIGINEDPVTGSAHCYLAHYWGEKLQKKKLVGYQASKRGGLVECEIIGNNRVLLRGDCVIMSEMKIEWNK